MRKQAKEICKNIITYIMLLAFIAQPITPILANPKIDAAGNGVPIVEINNPSKGGVSYNPFDRFDVNKNGLIFNNSLSITNTTLAGYIMGNKNLSGGPARLILAEVIGNNPSRLNGYMEIAGQRAGLIIANPNGISGSGFGFINANKVTLTTGKPILLDNGDLSYNVNKGSIQINGQGLDATGTEKIDILAQAVQINAGIWANEANIVTGTNKIHPSGAVEKIASAAPPEGGVALDIGALGGMYAGKIKLIGTEKGLGVNSRGTIQSTGDFTLDSQGNIMLSGNTAAGGSVEIKAKESVNNQKDIIAQGGVSIDAGQKNENSGSIISQGNLALSAGQEIINSGTVAAEKAMQIKTARLENKEGNIEAKQIIIEAKQIHNGEKGRIAHLGNEQMKITVQETIRNEGLIGTNGSLTLDAASITNKAGQISAKEDMNINVQSMENKTGAKIISTEGELNVSAQETLANDGTIAGSEALVIRANELTNNKRLFSQGLVRVDAGTLNNETGADINGQKITLTAADQIKNNASIIANRDMTIQAKKINAVGGTIAAGIDGQGQVKEQGTLSISGEQIRLKNENIAADIIISGQTIDMSEAAAYAKNELTITSGGKIDAEGAKITAGGKAKLNAGSEINNAKGQLAAGQIKLAAQELNNQDGKIYQQADENTEISITGKINNDNGQIVTSADEAAIKAGEITNGAGKILHIGKGVLALDVNRAVDNTRGQLQSSGELNLRAGSLKNQNGTLSAAKNLTVAAKQSIDNNQGKIAAGENAAITAGEISQSGEASITANQALAIKAGDLSNDKEGIIAGYGQGGLTVNVNKTLQNQGSLISASTTEITAQNMNNQSGYIFGRQAVRLSADDLQNSGQLSAGQNFEITVKNALNHTGMLAAGNDVNITAGKITGAGTIGAGIASDGTLLAKGNLTIQSQGQADLQGKNIAGGNIAITADTADFAAAATYSGGRTKITAKEISLDKGSIIAQGDLALTAKKELHSRNGQIMASGKMQITAPVIDNQNGKIAGQKDISLSGQTIDNTAGIIGSDDAVTISAQTMNNQSGKILAGSDLGLELKTKLDNRQGGILAGNNLAISGAALTADNTSGKIEAGGDIDLLARRLANENGNIAACNDARFLVPTFLNTGGTVKAGNSLNLSFQGDYTQQAGSSFIANGSLNMTTNGTITNAGTISAVKDLGLSANDVVSTGTIAANEKVAIKASQGIKNTGKITGDTLSISAQNIENTGALIGSGLTINAGNLNNSGASAVIATTQGMDLLVKGTLNNAAGATIYSLGDINIAADEQNHKTGQIMNQSAAIEAGKNISIAADQIVNKRTVFQTAEQEIGREEKREELPSHGVPPGISRVDILLESREVKQYTKVTTETKAIADSGAARILADGNISLTGGALTNYISEISAGENLNLNIENGAIQNIAAPANRTAKQENVMIIYSGRYLFAAGAGNSGGGPNWQERTYYKEEKGSDSILSVTPSGNYQAILEGRQSVNIEAKSLNNSKTSAGQIDIGYTGAVELPQGQDVYGQINIEESEDDNKYQETVQINAQEQNKIIKDHFNEIAGSAQSAVKIPPTNQGDSQPINGGFDWGNLKLNGLFTMHKEPAAQYLVETDKRFTDYKNFISSDYLLTFVGYDPAKTLKRLGDGFYEQQIIKDQIAGQRGTSLLDGYANNEEQYKALLENGAQAAKDFQLKIGISLTAGQINQLKKDIVWLEEKEIQGQKVLVPVVYLAPSAAKLETSGAIIKGGKVNIDVTADLQNEGKISAAQTMDISAGNLQNRGGSIIAQEGLSIKAKGDILNQSGLFSGSLVDIAAGGNITNKTITIKQDYGIGTSTLIGQKGSITAQEGLFLTAGKDILSQGADLTGKDIGLYAGKDIGINAVTIEKADLFNDEKTALTGSVNAAGNLFMSAGQDIRLESVKADVGKDLTIAAGRNVNITAAQETSHQSGGFGSRTAIDTKTQNSAEVSAQGSIQISAGNDITAKAAKLEAKEDIVIAAANNATLETAINTSGVYQDNKRQGWQAEQSETNVTTDLSAKNIAIASGKDINLKGAQIGAQETITLQAEENINITAVKDETKTQSRQTIKGGWKQTSADDEKVIGTNLGAGQDITIIGGEKINIKGSGLITEEGNIQIAGKEINIANEQEKYETEERSHTKKSGFLSKKTTDKYDYVQTNEVISSTLSGENVTLIAQEDIKIKGSNIVAGNELNALAGGNLEIESAARTGKEQHETITKKSGLLGGGGLGFTIGKREQKDKYETESLEQIGSVAGTLQGNISLQAGKDVNITASEILAGKDISINGQNVTIKEGQNEYKQKETHEYKQTGLSVSLGGGAIETAEKIVNPIKRAGEVKDERLQALYAYKAGKELEQNKEKLEQAGKGNLGLSLNVSIGTSKSESKAESQTTLAQGSTINAGGDLSITATKGDITLKGSTAEAENIKLKAEQNINLLAGENKNKTEENTKSSGASIGVSIDLTTGGVGINAGINKAQGQIKENGTTYTQTQITANDKLQIETGKDLDIIGSTVAGNKVEANIGGNLNIESLQDKQTYDEKNNSKGFNISTNLTGGKLSKPTIGGGTNKGKIESDYESVTDQAGIYAGQEGFDINVGKNTDLKGAVIASQAEKEKNKLSTETLTYEDIENKAEYSADSSGTAYNSQANLTEGIVAGLAPNVGAGAEGEAGSTTKSAIAQGTIEVRGEKDKDKDLTELSRDTENALNKLEQIFDKDEVKEKQELANLFSQLALKEIGELAEKHDKEILEKHKQIEEKGKQAQELRKNGKIQEAQQIEKEIIELSNQADKLYKQWKDGGTNKTILHALVGAITASLGGSDITTGLLGAGISEKLQGQLQNLSPEMRIWASAIIGMAVDKITGNETNTGAQAAIDGTKYNDLREAEIIAEILAAQKANKEVIEAATENVNKGGGKQNEEIVEKVTQGKEEVPKQEEVNNGYHDNQTTEMKENVDGKKEPEKENPNIKKANDLIQAGAPIVEDEKGTRYVREYQEDGSYIDYYIQDQQTKNTIKDIAKIVGENALDLVRGMTVGVDESLGFGIGQEIYFQITEKKIDGTETTAYCLGKVIGDGTVTILGALEMGKGLLETTGGIALAPATGGASTIVSADGVITTIAGGAIIKNSLENGGEDLGKLIENLGNKNEVKPNTGGGGGSSQVVTNSSYKSLPDNVKAAFSKYNKDGWNGRVFGQAEGTKAGGIYKNRDGKLPNTDASGNSVTYKEYDVNSKRAGQNRDAERFVRGSDGTVYYTNDHYGTFTKIN